MCRETVSPAVVGNNKLFLASIASFSGNTKDKRNPETTSMVATALAVILILCLVEQTLRQFFVSIQDFHPLLQDETSRNILARHIGVDAGSCFVVAYLGWKARHILQDMVDAVWKGTNSMPAAYENRMFRYQPESARITLFFFAYQIKNTYDTIVWNDGPEFIAHHVLTLATAWGALAQGSAHFYVPFYFGVSEISTAVLCLLANFDDVHGVKGLADAFPLGKAVLGEIFAVLFVICRVFLWSTTSWYYCRDCYNVLTGSDPRLAGRKLWFQFTFVSLALLSLLQIIWLAEIFRIGREELAAMGYL